MSRFLAKLRSEEGQVVVLAAFIMILFLGIVAVVLDLGILYLKDRELQTAADAAALAAVQVLPMHADAAVAEAEARVEAHDYVDKNSAPISHVDSTHIVDWEPEITADSITVRLRESNIPYFLARFLGFLTGSVHAEATARLMYLSGATSELLPLAMAYMRPESFRVTYTPENGGPLIQYELTNPLIDDPEADEGLYSNQVTYPGYLPPNAASGFYDIKLEALVDGAPVPPAWDNVGRWYLASETSKLQRVGIARNDAAKTIDVSVLTNADVTLSSLRIKLNGGSPIDLTRITPLGDPGIYRANGLSLGTLSFDQGSATIKVELMKQDAQALELPPSPDATGNSTILARFKLFKDPYPILGIRQLPELEDYAGYSAGPGDWDVDFGIQVQTRIFKYNVPTTLKVAFQSSGEYSGNQFWADLYKSPYIDEFGNSHPGAANLKTELDPDAADRALWEPKHPLQIWDGDPDSDIGLVETEPGGGQGQLSGLSALVGRVVLMPIVFPADLHGGSIDWRIQSFAAFQIDAVDVSQNESSITGRFVRWATAGEWTEDKPSGGFVVEVPVLTPTPSQ